jgi:hypothetical protein
MYTAKQDVLNAAFTAAGYDDVDFDEVITARRSDGREWEIVLDRSGQLKATITAAAGRPTEKTLSVLGRKALALTEHSSVTTVMFKLEDASELKKALDAIEAAIK